MDDALKPQRSKPGLTGILSDGCIASVKTRNRVIMSPMVTNFAEEDGCVNDSVVRHYGARARGGLRMRIGKNLLKLHEMLS